MLVNTPCSMPARCPASAAAASPVLGVGEGAGQQRSPGLGVGHPGRGLGEEYLRSQLPGPVQVEIGAGHVTFFHQVTEAEQPGVERHLRLTQLLGLGHHLAGQDQAVLQVVGGPTALMGGHEDPESRSVGRRGGGPRTWPRPPVDGGGPPGRVPTGSRRSARRADGPAEADSSGPSKIQGFFDQAHLSSVDGGGDGARRRRPGRERPGPVGARRRRPGPRQRPRWPPTGSCPRRPCAAWRPRPA